MKEELNLKELTLNLHDQTEELNFTDELKDGSLSESQYKTLILRNYIVNKHIENCAENLLEIPVEIKLDYPKRKKCHALKNEIKHLHLENDIPDVEVEKPVYNKHSVLGAIYVAEGSTLGGQYIHKRLTELPQFKDYFKNIDRPFFGVYGKETGPLWKSFKNIIQEYADKHECHSQIREGANETFQFFLNVSKSVSYS